MPLLLTARSYAYLNRNTINIKYAHVFMYITSVKNIRLCLIFLFY